MTLAHITVLNDAGIISSATALNFSNWLIVFLKAALAKSGVPLLSLISGYLAINSLQKYGYFNLLVNKAKRLIWPLFWVNLLFLLLITYPAQAIDPNVRPDLKIYPFDLLGWFQATFAFYKLPANQPLFFLKDLYTCFLLIPILIFLAKIKYINLLAIVWMAYKCIYLKTVFIFPVFPTWFFRFDIVFAFYLGILLFQHQKNLLIENRHLNLFLLFLFFAIGGLASIVYLIYAKAEHLTLFLWLDFTVKVFSVLGCVSIMSLLSGQHNNLSRLLAYLSPFSYTLFLTHVFTFTFFNRMYFHYFARPEFFELSGSLFVIFILLSAIGVSIILNLMWFKVIAPGLQAMWRSFSQPKA
jgi:succinoglycan biosynthesis protein ExoH